jgi:hypothetical protein
MSTGQNIKTKDSLDSAIYVQMLKLRAEETFLPVLSERESSIGEFLTLSLDEQFYATFM